MDEEPSKLTQSVSYPQYIVIESILTLYNNNSSLGLGSGQAERKLTTYVRSLIGPLGLTIIRHIHEKRAFTKSELEKIECLNWQSVNRIVNRYLEEGLIKRLGFVGLPFKPKGGRPVPIYGLLNAVPEDVTEAQKRYGEIRRVDPIHDLDGELIRDTAIFWETRSPTRTDIVGHLRNNGLDGPEVPDHAEAVIKLLEGSGVRVAR